ncbi:cyclophilin-like fold protein [Uliginosibacterium sediminicola]|uniref:Cyclophilin-like fold protein n=1 Tax=Uliginosibacterium sediminicola TaxID=2024550 RepID=A0ABU9Z0N2_9RHOO
MLKLMHFLSHWTAFAGVLALSTTAAPRHAWAAQNESAGTPILIQAAGHTIRATLNDSRTAQDFIKSLPRSLTMTRWGDREFYGKVGSRLFDAVPRQKGFADGDITYWVPGASFAIFYDSTKDQDIDDLIVIGKIQSDLSVFKDLDYVLTMRIELAP